VGWEWGKTDGCVCFSCVREKIHHERFGSGSEVPRDENMFSYLASLARFGVPSLGAFDFSLQHAIFLF
jgi:hypothetical protein